MRTIASCLAALLLLAAAACGGESQAYEFRSKARAPSGEPVPFEYRPKEGDAFRMSMRVAGSFEMSVSKSREKAPIEMSMRLAYRCEEVRPNGDARMSVTIEDAELQGLGADATAGSLSGMGASFVMDKHGSVSSLAMVGVPESMREEFEGLLNQPGAQQFLVFPREGLRVGQAIDVAESFEASMGQGTFGELGAGVKPTVRGEAVFVRTTVRDGEPAAEFELNVVVNVKGKAPTEGRDVEVDFGFRVTGSQFVSIATGMPVGTVSMVVEGRGRVGAGREMSNFSMDMRVTGAVEKGPPK
jgi:hypothetical protein